MAITWATHSRPAASFPIRDSICVGAGKFVAVGDAGRVYTSADSGQTWTARTASSANKWIALAYDGTTVIAVSNLGAGTRAMFSTDDGHTWTASTTVPEANNWQSVCSPAVGTFVAVSSNGVHRVMKTTDAGVNWSAISASSAGSWGGVATDGTLLVAKDTTDVMISSDVGATWTTFLAAVPAYNGPASMIRYSVEIAQFVGYGFNGSNHAVVYGSVDGQTWTLLSTITTHIGWGGFTVADSFGGFIGALPLTSGFGSTPTIIGWSDDGGANWTIDNTTFSGTWNAASWDPSGTVVFFDDATDVVLVGTAPVATLTGLSPSRGTRHGGTIVSIAGTGLSGITSVTFGGTAAVSVNAVSDVLVTCITPAHAVGIVDVVVGSVGTLSSAFTFVSVDRVSPSTGTIAGDTPVTITGSGFNLPATGVLFGSVAATDMVIVSDTSITAVTPAHASGFVDVTVSGVDVGTNLYTYTLPVPQTLGKGALLPPMPSRTPFLQGRS